MTTTTTALRTEAEVEALVLADYAQYKGRTILVHFATGLVCDEQGHNFLQHEFDPPLVAVIQDDPSAALLRWNEDGVHALCDPYWPIKIIEGQAQAGDTNWEIDGFTRSLDPSRDDLYEHCWELASRKYILFGPWQRAAIPR